MNSVNSHPAMAKYKYLGQKVLKLQSIGVILAALAAWYWGGWHNALALLLGGALAILPNALFMLWLFAQLKPSDSQRMIRAFYMGELIKLLIMAGGLIALFQWWQTKAGTVLIGFLTALVLYWLMPLVTARKQ